MAYDSPGTLGPTADYSGDPNDYNGGSGFNANSFVDSLTSNLGGILGGIGSIIGATRGNTTNQPFSNAPQGYYPQQQQQPQSQNTVMYIGIAVLVFVILIALIFLLKK